MVSDWAPGPAWLFCPADRPDRYRKALVAADVVILDLEDAVARTGKEAARRALAGLLENGEVDFERTIARVNATETLDHELDLRSLRGHSDLRLMVAKASDPRALDAIDHELLALIETPAGLIQASQLASHSNVLGLMWGADDLVAGLGGTASRHGDGTYRDVAMHARSTVLVAAKAFGRLAVDGVHMNISDSVGLSDACVDAAAVGFDATAAIHPAQVEVIRRAYAPTAEEVDRAERLLAATRDAGGVAVFEGRMVDGPIYRQAQRIMSRRGCAR